MQTLIQSPDFQRIFESAPGAYLVLAPDLTILAASDAYLRATMTRREEIVGHPFFDVFPDNPDDPEATGQSNLLASMHRVIRDKVPDAMAVQKYDIPRPRDQGGGFEVRCWSPSNFPVIRDGELDCIIHYVQDATEYMRLKELDAPRLQAGELVQLGADQMEAEVFKRAQEIQETNARLERTIEQLRQSEEMSRLFMEGVREYAMFLLDAHGNVKTWTPAAQRIKGYTAQEIVGKHFSVFYPPEDVETGKPQHELETALNAGQYEEVGWRIRKDGSRFWANVLITALKDPDGKHIGYSKITRDLTERLGMQDERDRFFFLSLDMLCIADFDGHFQRVNPAFMRVLGYTEEEMLSIPYVDLIHPDDVAATQSQAARLVDGETVVDFENRYRRKDGAYRWLSWVASSSTRARRMYAAARDITDRKMSETAMRELNQTLQTRTQQLEASNRELEAFSYSVSHDLRAPLRTIDGFSLAVIEDCAGKLDAQNLESLNRVRAAAQRMAQLIDDMLNLSRITRMEMRRDEVDMGKIAREIADELRAADPDRNVEFVIADRLIVHADPRLIRVAITNLLANAWKFTGKRPIGRIEFGQTQDNGVKTFFVRDNGAGFDMAYAKKLFGAFQRLHPASEYPGTGIGLATVQRVIARHGGRVWTQAAVDQGATFYFTL